MDLTEIATLALKKAAPTTPNRAPRQIITDTTAAPFVKGPLGINAIKILRTSYGSRVLLVYSFI